MLDRPAGVGEEIRSSRPSPPPMVYIIIGWKAQRRMGNATGWAVGVSDTARGN
jgi:hypothetical protein